nr:cupin domain-containing protein [uncultured Albidiferax sp.]
MSNLHHLDSLPPLASGTQAGTRLAARYIVYVLASASCCVVLAQVVGPTENKGVTTTVLGSIDLSSEIPEVAGRQLRARTVTIEPGGHTAVHTHVSRPTFEYVLQGNVVEVRNGVEVPHAAGEMVPASNGVSHYWENRGTSAVILMPVDIFKP